MGSTQAVTGSLLGALSGGVVVIEIIIVVVIIGLLITVLMLYRRQQQGPKQEAAAPAPDSYYADVSTLQGVPGNEQGGFGQQPAADPFAGFGGGQGAPGAAPPPAAPAPAAAATPPAPPPGTAAGWLPDPTGVPDTLRYWDGNAWTQHVAQRG